MFFLFFYRIWLYYSTKNICYNHDLTKEENHKVLPTPAGWHPDYKTKKNILIWILFGRSPWKERYLFIKIKSYKVKS
jgi:hypothetical protein